MCRADKCSQSTCHQDVLTPFMSSWVPYMYTRCDIAVITWGSVLCRVSWLESGIKEQIITHVIYCNGSGAYECNINIALHLNNRTDNAHIPLEHTLVPQPSIDTVQLACSSYSLYWCKNKIWCKCHRFIQIVLNISRLHYFTF